MEEIVKQLQEDIKEAYEYFDNEQHFQDVVGEAGWNESNMRILDCGYIKGMQNALNKLQEYGETK
jgi:hypothetical protein